MDTTIIKKPIITEKSLEDTSKNRYTFEVAINSNKNQIKEAIEAVFKVNVIGINTITKRGVAKRTGRRRLPGKTSDFKKAIVQIKSGQTIKVFETKG